MSFQEFKQQISSLVVESDTTYFGSLFHNPIFAILVSVGVVLLALVAMVQFSEERIVERNPILDMIYSESVEEEVAIGGIVALMLMVFFSLFYGLYYAESKDELSEEKATDVYIAYMESQEDLTLKVSEYTLDDDVIDNIDYDEYDDITTYIYDNAQCKNCVEMEVAFKHSEKDKEYKKMDVLVSFTLEEDEKPYLVTKPKLRENVEIFESDAYYNPILFVPKNEGGIAQ